MAYIDLSPILKDYEGKWVALSEDNRTVYVAANTAPEVVRIAESKGHADYTLLYVTPFDTLYCGCIVL